MPIRIVIAQRGWIFVGYFEQNGHEITLTKAKTIRRWGTTKGLAELAGGPTKETVLDEGGTIRLHLLTVVAMFDANAKAWAKVLK